MRLGDLDELKAKLQEHHDFFVNAYGGFKNLPPNDKARVDEIIHCISEIVNAPTVEITEEQAIDKLHETGWLPEHDRQMTERPQGKKIKKRHYGWVYCSECDSLLGQQDKFCWNCGADVRNNNKETTFDDYLKEQLKNPEFRKEWEKLQDDDMRGGAE